MLVLRAMTLPADRTEADGDEMSTSLVPGRWDARMFETTGAAAMAGTASRARDKERARISMVDIIGLILRIAES